MITEKIFETVIALLHEKDQRKATEMMQVPMGLVFSDGEVGYVSFTLQEDYGNGVDLHLLMGEQGLQDYLQMLTEMDEGVYDILGEPDYRDVPVIPCVSLSLAGEESLTHRELKQCKEICRKRGWEFTGGREDLWPVLRRREPFYLEMQVTDPVDVKHMEEAAVAAAWAAPRLRQGKLPDQIELLAGGQLLMLTPSGKGYRVRRVDLPPVRRPVYPLQELSAGNRIAAKNLAKLPHRGRFEVALCDLPPEDVLTEDGLPLPPYLGGTSVLGVLAIARQGVDEGLFESDRLTVEDFARHPEHLLENLSKTLLLHRICPKEILVADDRTRSFLAQWCAAAGVKLTRVKEVPELREAWTSEWGDAEEDRSDWEPDLRNPDVFLRILAGMHEVMEQEKGLPLAQRKMTAHLREQGRQADEMLDSMDLGDFAQMPDDVLLELLLLTLLDLLDESNAEKVCTIAAARGYDPGDLFGDEDEDEEDDEDYGYAPDPGKVLPFPGLKKNEGAEQWEMSFDELMRGIGEEHDSDDSDDDGDGGEDAH